MDKITHILTSPLRRTLQTTLLAFEPAIKAGIKPVALDLLRETGKGRNSWGSDLPTLLKELGELGESVLTTEVEHNWEIPTRPIGVLVRAHSVRFKIKYLARVARMQEAERAQARSALGGSDWVQRSWCHANRWLMSYDVPHVEKDRDVHIAVVSHGSFLRKVIGEEKTVDELYNAEYKTFVFKEEECEGGVESYELVETEDSSNRSYTSTCEEAIAERMRAIEAADIDVSSGCLIEMAKQALVRVEEIEITDVYAMDVDVAQEEITLS
ncbi:hypothetical protein DL98DRAFT_518474 [Cadophora sp. DSE1049]|nr:hypothetical protein DL98DRAFT_518474 [Cadophora sp. DSE1049]